MIAVVGGGISGLTVGRQLAERGAEVVVYEATERPGGVIESVGVEGRVLELGPQRARLTSPFRRAMLELGLETRLVTSAELPLYVWTEGRLRLVPMSVGAALRTDLIGWRDRIRVLAEPFTGGLRDDETAAEFFTRKFGRRVYERVIAPLYGGLYASDPAEMPARHALAATLETLGVGGSLLAAMVRGSRVRQSAPACSFRDGLQTLTDALAAELGDRLRLGSPVRSLTREDGRFILSVGGGAGAGADVTAADVVRADVVVLACPSGAAAGILRSLAPEAADRLARLRYNRLALVHLLSDADLKGLGYQVGLTEGEATRGVTWNHAMFGRHGLYTAFLGGALHPQLADRPDGELKRLALAEFREMTGEDGRAIHVSRTWIPAWDRSWDALDGLELPEGVRVCANWAGRPGITGRLTEAGSLAEDLSEGRLRGRRARGGGSDTSSRARGGSGTGRSPGPPGSCRR